MGRRWGLSLLTVLAAGGAGYYLVPVGWLPDRLIAARTARPATVAEARPLPVVTRIAERRPMPVQIATIGTVQPIATVSLRARVDSVVDGVNFVEGQEVRKGQLLFELDARGAEAQLRQAQANLERDRAQLDKARLDVARYTELLKTNAVARQQVDAATSQVSVLEATVKADTAAADAARLTLSYTRVESPIDGRTGSVMVKAGNQVRANDVSPLVVVTQLRPIQVGFNVAERDLTALRAAASAGTVSVLVSVRGDPGGPVAGRLDFIDNAVDAATGTILLKATFTNEDTRLWPGQFVEVVLTLRVDPGLLTVPAEALQIGQDSPFVFLVRPNQSVEIRSVEMIRTVGGFTAIAKGLTDGDRVVVDGQSRLIPGSRITERGAGPPASAPAPPRDGDRTDPKPADKPRGGVS